MPAVVDLEKCDGCLGRKEKGTSACVEECPVECIRYMGVRLRGVCKSILFKHTRITLYFQKLM